VRDGVNLAKSRQPAPDVHELADRRPGTANEIPDGAAEELPVVIAGHAGVWDQLKKLLGGVAIGLAIILPA
jgi:hypothetical protein